MNCAEVHEHLSPPLDQSLGAELTEKVEAHLAQCVICGAEFERLQRLKGVLQASERHAPSAALEARVMSTFHEHHQRHQAATVRGWQRWFLGTVSLPKPALPLAVAAMIAVGALTFSLGRMTASRAMLPPLSPNVAVPQSAIIAVPVERERIVYAPNSHANPNSSSLASTTAKLPPALSPTHPTDAQKTSVNIASLDDFEPIKGTTARVIKGGTQR